MKGHILLAIRKFRSFPNFIWKRIRGFINRKFILPVISAVVDIRNCPKATGLFRRRQEINLDLLRIFDAVCEKYKVQYYIMYGTLLGAVRHNGFIPWDDDVDVELDFDSYQKIRTILEKEFEGSNIRLYGITDSRLGTITLRMAHKQYDWMNLDVFCTYPSARHLENRDDCAKLWKDLKRKMDREYVALHRAEDRDTIARFREKYETLFGKIVHQCRFDTCSVLADNFFGNSTFHLFRKEWIYPLKRISFEGVNTYVPNNTDAVLRTLYKDYMAFPVDFYHHNGEFNLVSEDDAVKAEADLKEVLAKIRGV